MSSSYTVKPYTDYAGTNVLSYSSGGAITLAGGSSVNVNYPTATLTPDPTSAFDTTNHPIYACKVQGVYSISASVSLTSDAIANSSFSVSLVQRRYSMAGAVAFGGNNNVPRNIRLAQLLLSPTITANSATTQIVNISGIGTFMPGDELIVVLKNTNTAANLTLNGPVAAATDANGYNFPDTSLYITKIA